MAIQQAQFQIKKDYIKWNNKIKNRNVFHFGHGNNKMFSKNNANVRKLIVVIDLFKNY